MNIEEARLYLEHTSKDDFNLEEWENENRYQAIQVVLEEIERLNNIIVKLKKVLWQRSEEARKNEQYIRLNCYKDILNELVNTIYEVDDETNE